MNSKTLSHHTCHDGTILLPTFVEYSRWHRIVNYGKNFTLDDCSNLSLCVFCCCHVARSVYERHCACEKKKITFRSSRFTHVRNFQPKFYLGSPRFSYHPQSWQGTQGVFGGPSRFSEKQLLLQLQQQVDHFAASAAASTTENERLQQPGALLKNLEKHTCFLCCFHIW